MTDCVRVLFNLLFSRPETPKRWKTVTAYHTLFSNSKAARAMAWAMLTPMMDHKESPTPLTRHAF